jgi:hypothetical protein
MANKRLITSAIWEDDWFGQLGFFEQALWIGLFSKCADDQGRLLDNAVLMRAAIFPYKDIDIAEIDAALDGFVAAGRIHRYESGGKGLIQILNWWAHQPQQWASESKWASPDGWVDHVRTRVNGQYYEDNWRSKAENAEDNATWAPQQGDAESVQVNGSGERFTSAGQVGGHVPVPDPVPDPVPVPSDSAGRGVAAPTDSSDGDAEPETEAEPEPEREKPKTPPAILAFRSSAHRYPAKSWWKRVDAIVGDAEPDVERWQKLVFEWVGNGWNPTNVKGMLDAYQSGGIQPASRGSPKKPTQSDRIAQIEDWVAQELGGN